MMEAANAARAAWPRRLVGNGGAGAEEGGAAA